MVEAARPDGGEPGSELAVVRHPGPDGNILYSPAGDGPFPAVLLLHGSEGSVAGWSHVVAALLAAHGLLAAPVGYGRFSSWWTAGDIVDVELTELADALGALHAHRLCAGQAGLYGHSRGAEAALLLATLMTAERHPDTPAAVAAASPADVVVGGFRAAWRWSDATTAWDPALTAWTWRGSAAEIKPSTPIPVERLTMPVFLSHGEADLVWSVDMTKRLAARLTAAGNPPDLHLYPDEGHALGAAASNRQLAALVRFFKGNLAGGPARSSPTPTRD